MGKKRAFSSEGIRQKKDDYHGSCRYVRTSPDIAKRDVKSINVELTFESAMQLSLGIQSALTNLNRYHRGTTEGREMRLCIAIKTAANSISVIEARVSPASD